ncbi:MAG: NrsF family protein [Bradyrhizobium sp.]|uniref:NrsF family protein n=1 Tax=Bradyrhizobium sp. TaxID=376 RepID=UPI00272184CF|nr:NrsF family protein [Bradyrhizobium sp.]MDO9561569.1 NrsF family protein [Bradyrhizobium sp.]MDP3694431.1 NrsF family protein [Bradyrhizobium sp.]
MDTDKLIAGLTEHADAVRRLPSPWVRTASWFAMAVPYVVAIVMIMTPRDDLAVKFTDFRFLVEQVAALCTAIGAAVAAFQSIVPGYSRRLLLLPLVPLSVWLASVGEGCVEALLRGGALQTFTSDFLCIPAIALVGALPAVAMTLMLRKGAPLWPYTSAALGGLAAAGLGNFGLRFFHGQDASLMVLVWQVGTVFMLTILCGQAGRLFLDWRPAIARARRNLAAH